MAATLPPVCSYPKCSCKGFKAPKWGGNECAVCFHFQEKHSANADVATPSTVFHNNQASSTSAAALTPSASRTIAPSSSTLASRAASPARRASHSTTGSATTTATTPTAAATKPSEVKASRPSFVKMPPTKAAAAETKSEPVKAPELAKPHVEPEKIPEPVKEQPKSAPAVKEEVKKPAPAPPTPSPSPKTSSAPAPAPAPAPISVPEPVVEAHKIEVVTAPEEHSTNSVTDEQAQMLSPSRMRLLSNVPEANFAKNLPHMFPLVSKQVGMGLYGVKRIATTLKEVCAYQKGCPSVEAMIKDSENRTAVHRHAEGHDDMQMLYQYASSAILGTLGQYISKAHTNFLSKVDNEATGLMSFYTSSERIRASLIDEAGKAEAVVTNATRSLAKEREVVSKAYTQLQSKKEAITKMSADERKKKGPSEEKTYYALRQKTSELFGSYEKQVDDTAELQNKYYNTKLPRIMKELEALEKSRLQMLNDKFMIYNRMLQEHIDEITAIRDSIQLIPTTLDPDQAMVDFVETVTSRLGHATPTLFAYYDFHVTADEVLSEPIDDASDALAAQKASLKAGETLATLSGKYESKSRLFSGTTSRAKRALLSKTFKKEAFEQAHAETKESASFTATSTVPPEASGENQLAPGTIVIAQFPYKSDAVEELQFNVGDSITVSESIGTWWSGKLNGQGPELLFPYNFVAVDTNKDAKVRCEAMFDFSPGPELENPDEYLTFKVGDIIEATSSADAWWHGTCKGRQGYFPFAFTQLK